jgi:hypothetical protein
MKEMKEMTTAEVNPSVVGITKTMENIVQSIGTYLAQMRTRRPATPNFGMRRYATLSHM